MKRLYLVLMKIISICLNTIPHFTILYILIFLLLNSTFAFPIFHRFVNELFSGGIYWSKLEFGPYPWQVKLENIVLREGNGNIVATSKSMEVKEFYFQSLFDDAVMAKDIDIHGLAIDLQERESLLFHESLWNIAELFLPLEEIVEDGEISKPMNLDFRNINIYDAQVSLKMDVIALDAQNIDFRDAYFHFLVESKKMYMGAQSMSLKTGESHIFLREDDPLIPPKTMDHHVQDLYIDDFFWRDQDFGARRLSTLIFDQDQVQCQNLLMNIIPGSIPKLQMDLQAKIQEIGKYVKTWDLDQKMVGSISAQGKIYGPVSNFAGSIEAQGHFDQIFSIPIEHYDLKFTKNLDDQVMIHRFDIQHPSAHINLLGQYQISQAQGLLHLKVMDLKWYELISIPKNIAQKYKNWLKPIKGDIDIQAYQKINQFDLIPHLLIQTHLQSNTAKPLNFNGLFSLDPNHGVEILRSDLHSGRVIKLKTDGKILFHPILSLDLKNELKLNLSEAKVDVIDIPIQGNINMQSKIMGTLDQLKYQVQINAPKLKGYAFPLSIQSLDTNLSGNLDGVDIHRLKADILGGKLNGKLAIDFKNPSDIHGWYLLEPIQISDEILNELSQTELFDFSTQIQSFGCHSKHGCEEFLKLYPWVLDRYQISNLSLLMSDAMINRDSFDVALELNQPRVMDLSFDRLSMFIDWEKFDLSISMIELKRKNKLFMTGSTNIDFAKNAINQLSLNIRQFPLNLVQLFTRNPNKIVKSLTGNMNVEIKAKGQFDNITSEAVFNFKKLAMQLPRGDDDFNLSLGKSDFAVELKNHRLNVRGILSKVFELEAFLPLQKKDKIELAELKLNIKNLSSSYLRAIPEDEESYIDEYKVLSKMVQNEIDFAPIPLLDATEGLSFIGLGKTFYCASQALPLIHGQLAHLFLNGIIRLKFDPFQRIKPVISTAFDQFQFDYWMRGDEGELIQLPNSPPCASFCTNQEYICPTISLKSREPIEFELLQHQNQLLAYFNPVQNQDSSLENEENLSKTHVETCNQFESKGMLANLDAKTKQASLIKVMPITLEGSNQKIVLGGFAEGDQLKGCSNANFDLSVLFPFLSNIYQQIEGNSQLFTALHGQLSNPKIEGFFKIKELNLLSPRSQIIGELRLIDPLNIQINPLDEGGFSTSLPAKQEVSFNWDDGEIKMKSFQLQLPLFKFERFTLDFSANQLELNLPDMVKLSAQLQDMRFEFYRKGNRLEDQKMVLSGDIELLRGVYKGDIQGSSEINEDFRNNIAGKSKVQSLSIYEKSPILKRLFLNLRVRGENDFFIRNQVAVVKLNLEISMDLRLKGYLYSLETDLLSEQLRLSGELRTLSGSKITYANRPFDVMDGIIRFGDGLNTGQAGNFLTANLEATHTFRIPKTAVRGRQVAVDQSSTSEMIEEEVTLRTKVEMPSKNAKPLIDFNLTSPSGASKLELATLVLTGKFPSKVNTATSAQPATEVLLSPLLNLIERPIEDTLDLDLNLTPDTTGLLFVDLNKIFSRRLRLYARTPIGDDLKNNSQLFSLEYRFNNLIYGEISNDRVNQVTSTNGRFRLRLSWD